MGRCRNCCTSCRGNVPASWTVPIDGHDFTLTRSRTDCAGTAAATTFSCVWTAEVDQELWGCADAACIALTIQPVTTVDGEFSDYILRVSDADNQALAFWTYRANRPADCLVERTLDLSAGVGACEGDAEATVTITPGPIGRCCPCSLCCDECAGADYSATRWNVTIDGKAFSVPRQVLQDEPADEEEEVSAVCVWRLRVNTVLFGVLAKDLIIRVYHHGSGISTTYRFDLELTEEDDSEHTLWADSALGAWDCSAAQTLNRQSGHGTGDLVVEPAAVHFCQPPAEGSGDCVGCPDGDAPESYDVDLGDPFLGDCACDACAAVSGVFELTAAHIYWCHYSYSEPVWCQRAGLDENLDPITLDIPLVISMTFNMENDGKRKVSLVISLGGQAVALYCDNPTGGTAAGYGGGFCGHGTITERACSVEEPITLYRLNQGIGLGGSDCDLGDPPEEQALCEMADFPETITITPVLP